ncbi:hypothetical protein YC2023_083168 [Brassica napus]
MSEQDGKARFGLLTCTNGTRSSTTKKQRHTERKNRREWKGFAGEFVAREGGERQKEREIAGEEEERNGEEDAFGVYKTLGPTDIFRRNSLSIFNFNFSEIFGGLFPRLNENIPRKFRWPLKYPSEFPRNIFINSRKTNILCMYFY